MHKGTKAMGFDRKVKTAVSIRDSIDGWPCCVFCGLPAPSELAWSNAHYIARSQGGLGVEENGLTLCPTCHKRYDQTAARDEMRGYFREYLSEHYENWSESTLLYKKGETI